MHPNPAFRKTEAPSNLAFAQARGFGTLSINGSNGPLCAHIPFLLSQDGSFADMHLARSNLIARADLPVPAVLAVVGPEGYISPDWYGTPDQVPTWNYVAVHLRGVLEPRPTESLREHVDALSARFEADLGPKAPWISTKMSDGVIERMMRMILPFRLRVTEVDGTWKLGQNKTPEAREGAAIGLDARGAHALAALMRAVTDAA